MKYILTILLSLSLAKTEIKDPVKIVFFGDSITQMGVQNNGYVTQIRNYIQTNHPGKFEAISSGIGGNKIYDLYLRMDEMLDLHPDIVVIYVGINDVWHKSSMGTGTDPDKFVLFYEKIIGDLKSRNIQVLLATPTVIGEKTDFSNPQDGDLNQYAKLIRNLAQKYQLKLIDLRESFLQYNLKNNPENKERGILTTDRVHLTEAGNTLVADMMIQALFK